MDTNACCAHLTISYSPLDNGDGSLRDSWLCKNCGGRTGNPWQAGHELDSLRRQLAEANRDVATLQADVKSIHASLASEIGSHDATRDGWLRQSDALKKQLAEANAELLKQSTIAWEALSKPDGTYTTTTVERLAVAYTQLRGASGSCAECERLTRENEAIRVALGDPALSDNASLADEVVELADDYNNAWRTIHNLRAEVERLNNWIEASAKLTHNDPLINKGEDAHQAIRRLAAEVERLTTAPSDAEIVAIRRRLKDAAIEFENNISSRGYSKFFDAMNDAEVLMRRAKAAPIAAGKDGVGELVLQATQAVEWLRFCERNKSDGITQDGHAACARRLEVALAALKATETQP